MPALKTNSLGGHCVTLLFILPFTLLITLYFSLFYLPTPRTRVYLEKLTSFQLVKKFPALCGTRSFLTAFKSDCHASLTWATSIQSMPSYPTAWSSILILSYHTSLGLQSGLFLSGFPPTAFVQFYSLPCTSTDHLSHSPWLYDNDSIWRRANFLKLLTMKLFPTSCHFSRS